VTSLSDHSSITAFHGQGALALPMLMPGTLRCEEATVFLFLAGGPSSTTFFPLAFTETKGDLFLQPPTLSPQVAELLLGLPCSSVGMSEKYTARSCPCILKQYVSVTKYSKMEIPDNKLRPYRGWRVCATVRFLLDQECVRRPRGEEVSGAL